MAKAEAVTIEEVEVKLTPGYSLHITNAEAETLLLIMGKVRGDPHNSRRKHTDAVSSALRGAGVIRPNTQRPSMRTDNPDYEQNGGDTFLNFEPFVKGNSNG